MPNNYLDMHYINMELLYPKNTKDRHYRIRISFGTNVNMVSKVIRSI